MIERRQMIGVPASIADWLAGGAERFWEAADGCLSAWLTQAIGVALEHEVQQFVGAAWHERAPQARKTYRSGYRPRRFMVLGREVTLRMPRVRAAGFRPPCQTPSRAGRHIPGPTISG